MHNSPCLRNGRLAVVYLARQAEGRDALARFVRSYQAHDAGIAHDLIVIYKGYQQNAEFDLARAVFSALPHQAIEIDDQGFDIDAYHRVARQIDHALVCFLNTHTEICATGWLALLERQATRPEVGVAAAMGSFESLLTSSQFIQAIADRCFSASQPPNAATEYYFAFVLNECRRQLAARQAAGAQSWLSQARHHWARACRFASNRLASLRMPVGEAAQFARFPRFPNPHIRSNGFLMLRERFLELGFSEMSSKWDAYAFESGIDSLTARLRRQGLATVVVDRAGHGYEVGTWCRSGTFRMGEQRNILLSDNQTRLFATMAPGHQAAVQRMTWGDYLAPAPVDFPDLSFKFALDPHVVQPTPADVTAGVPLNPDRLCA